LAVKVYIKFLLHSNHLTPLHSFIIFHHLSSSLFEPPIKVTATKCLNGLSCTLHRYRQSLVVCPSELEAQPAPPFQISYFIMVSCVPSTMTCKVELVINVSLRSEVRIIETCV
jgi:hypothetical protein